MVFEADVGSMSPKRRTVLLAEDEHRPCGEIGSGMLSPALPEILPVEIRVVLVGNRRPAGGLPPAARGQGRFPGVVPVSPPIINVPVGRAIEPPLGGHPDRALEVNPRIDMPAKG